MKCELKHMSYSFRNIFKGISNKEIFILFILSIISVELVDIWFGDKGLNIYLIFSWSFVLIVFWLRAKKYCKK